MHHYKGVVKGSLGFMQHNPKLTSRDTKLERFLPKNQHTQRKLLNFENWTHSVACKIRVFKVDYFDFSCKKMKN
jgi:hypothetical protein